MQNALVVRIKVLDHHERHPGVDRQGLEQRRASLQAPGGGANPHNRKLRSGGYAGGFRCNVQPAFRACRRSFRRSLLFLRHVVLRCQVIPGHVSRVPSRGRYMGRFGPQWG